MKTNSKFNQFVAKIEQKMLDSNQESMILTGSEGEELGGNNSRRCTNKAAACDSSINDRKCTNGNSNGCDGSINGKCTLIEASIIGG